MENLDNHILRSSIDGAGQVVRQCDVVTYEPFFPFLFDNTYYERRI